MADIARHMPGGRLVAGLATVALAAALAGPGAEAASARHKDRLLAPKKVCQKQGQVSLSAARQEGVMRCTHNYARRKAGLRAMRKRGGLQWSAGQKAVEILKCQDFSHSACGRDPFYWLRRTGLLRGCYGAGENIGFGSGKHGSVRNVMSAWLHSDGHRRALLSSRHRTFGVGVARGSFRGFSSTQIWVAHFAYTC
jgi:uncharacterized protein YkwD